MKHSRSHTMFDRLNHLICSILIIHFLKSASVYAIRECDRDEILCRKDGWMWCCNSVSNTCGRSVGSCRGEVDETRIPSTFRASDYTPTTSTRFNLIPSDVTTSINPVAIIIPVMVVFVSLIICCVICIFYQRQRKRFSPPSIITFKRQTVQSHQQLFVREPPAVFNIQSDYNADITIPVPPHSDTYEAPPPSYSIANNHFLSIHQPESLPPPPPYSMIHN